MYRVRGKTAIKTKLITVVMRLAVLCSSVIFSASNVLARCAMCKLAVSGSDSNGAMVSSLNLGILVLLIPPVVIFGALLIVLYRYAKLSDYDQHSPEQSS